MTPTSSGLKRSRCTPFVLGWALLIIGLLITVFSRTIVFPGLERILGIETIVGRENVSYQADGSYFYTNPVAMMRWIASVAGIGLFVASLGIFILRQTFKQSGTSAQPKPDTISQ